MIDLTKDQEKRAVQLFAQGFSRSEVVSELIDNDSEISDQLKASQDEPKFRKELSDKLMSCDPTSTRFAVTKHKDHYDTHKAALSKALSNTYQGLVVKSVKWLEKSIARIDDKIESLEHNLGNALETFPVGSSEYVSMMNALSSLEKRKLELQDKYLERLERIHQQTIAF